MEEGEKHRGIIIYYERTAREYRYIPSAHTCTPKVRGHKRRHGRRSRKCNDKQLILQRNGLWLVPRTFLFVFSVSRIRFAANPTFLFMLCSSRSNLDISEISYTEIARAKMTRSLRRVSFIAIRFFTVELYKIENSRPLSIHGGRSMGTENAGCSVDRCRTFHRDTRGLKTYSLIVSGAMTLRYKNCP